MQLSTNSFKKQLEQFIKFRGIDIVLHLRDGSMLELNKNRQMEGDLIYKNGRDGIEMKIDVEEIVRADFYAA